VWGRHRPHLSALLDSLARDRDAIGEIVVSVPDGVVVDDDRITRVATHRVDQSPFAAAAAAASGEVAIALDEAMILDDGSSVAEVVALLQDGDVAAVGTAQFRPDGCVRHGGLVVQRGTIAPILHGWHRDHGGPGRVMDVDREVTAVDLVGSAWRLDDLRTVANLADGRSDSVELGVRACLAARAAGRRVLWTPFTSFTRCDRGTDGPIDTDIDTPERDPYYNPNLVAGRADWLELPGRAGAPPYVVDASGRRHWA
jgi:hypothetical protein